MASRGADVSHWLMIEAQGALCLTSADQKQGVGSTDVNHSEVTLMSRVTDDSEV